MNAEPISVEVVYALPDGQHAVSLEVPAGTTAREAVQRSGILQRCPEIDASALDLGVHGRPVAPDQSLCDGDRVEIYRPLAVDPKDARRQRAAEGKAAGKRRRTER